MIRAVRRARRVLVARRTWTSRGPRRPGGRERGQGLVEFALVLPFLLFLLLGIVDFARGWFSYQVLTDAARRGARMAVIDDPTVAEGDVVAEVRDALRIGGLDPNRATVQIDGFRSGRGNPAGVAIDYPYTLRFVGRIFGWFTGDPNLTLRTQFEMRNE